MRMACVILGDLVLTLLQTGCGQEMWARIYGKKLILLKMGKTTAGELWRGITAIILLLAAKLPGLRFLYGNMVMTMKADVLSQVVTCIVGQNFKNFTGNIYTVIIVTSESGH